MRFLLINNHCITDSTAGVTQSLRTIMRWLLEAGHECQVLTTARFESPVTFTIEEHLRQCGVPAAQMSDKARKSAWTVKAARPVIRYQADGVPTTLLLTRHNDESRPDATEAAQYGRLFDAIVSECAPDVVIACNAHPMIRQAMHRARDCGITTAFAVRGFGYYEPRYFDAVNHAFTCSQFLTDLYFEKVRLVSTPLEPPIQWDTVLAPQDSRAFVTFVHPAPHKGLWLFARLADMLGLRRPDIPILVVQSGQSGGSLNTIPGIDFSRYPQIMAAPPVPKPADYFALTRLLLVPSVWEEPFGRVAAEAMINGIPALVGNRGSLPGVVGGDVAYGGGGRVLPIPEWMSFATTTLPSEHEVEPWYEAVCTFWDNAETYDATARRARQIAEERYSEAVSRQRHLDYFLRLTPDGRPLAAGNGC